MNDSEIINRVRECVEDWSMGNLSNWTAMYIVANIVNQQEITEEDMEWAKQKIAELPEKYK